ncbi:MAG: crotonase/enoyl-CoA hydratase family protein [Gammaproteobacteria bacterium]|nr:crotonase/enoyl-CoA hydratase family protein [Gammaproteobacteria bacterium]MBU1776579.1 crotonase/enoyl-CoA hydratase family protein [Gammaproteobacteria bacterium]MBU1967910.1 crotonase/enoyl-CoA hydratase family protein [Gammaproteobacteria bacterium]
MRLVQNPYDLMNFEYSQLRTRFDAENGALWTLVSQDSIPCVTPELLNDLDAHHKVIEKSRGNVLVGEQMHQIRYSVLASITPGVFNLGGQLALFRQLIRNQNRDALLKYATACIDVIFPRMRHFDLPLATITLLQGDALGGGLEAALASDIVIAERNCQMGFPEILFNLFPGMGAYSFIARKVSPRFAEKMILGGKIYSAEELYDEGLVDILAEEGKGVEAVNEYIRKQERRSNGFLAVQKAKHRFNPVTQQELMDITTVWVDAALKLNEKDLKVMDRFVRSQEKLFLQPQEQTIIPNAA